MIIMFVIAATTSVGAVATLYMASSYCIDACCRLRLDRISKRDKANAWNARLGRKVAQVRLTWDAHCNALTLTAALALSAQQQHVSTCDRRNIACSRQALRLADGRLQTGRGWSAIQTLTQILRGMSCSIAESVLATPCRP